MAKSKSPASAPLSKQLRPWRKHGDRLLNGKELEQALKDRALEPLKMIPMSAVREQLQKLVDDEGGPSAFARLTGSTQSQVSEALTGRRNGIGTQMAAYLGLKPRLVRIVVYEVQNPRKFYRASRFPNL